MSYALINSKTVVRLSAALCLLFAVQSLLAEPLKRFQWHGFFNQALIKTSANHFFGPSDKLSAEFTEMGLNGSFKPTPDWQFSGQLLSRRAGALSDGSPQLDYGFVDYRINSDMDGLWGVRLGRVKNPMGFYNETRDVAHTRPSILLPQSTYLDRSRDMYLSTDAVYLYGEERTDYGDYTLNVGVGYPRADSIELERVLMLNKDWAGHLQAEIPSYLGRLIYDWQEGRVRVGLTWVKAQIDFKTGAGDLIPSGSICIEPRIFSLQYNSEFWSLTAEYTEQKTVTEGLGFLIADEARFSESYYVQAQYRFAPKWEWVLRYDVQYFGRDDKTGEKLASSSPILQSFGLPAVLAHSRFSKDSTVGLRWNVAPQWVLQAEYHRVNGTSWLALTENPDPLATKQFWDLYTLAVSYRF
ncbi:MAG: hypothetical protein Q9O24_05305 [Gammaproteobacteria bacterium]|nr:hypothetical protein [Gammaproteobacteria bacterium]